MELLSCFNLLLEHLQCCYDDDDDHDDQDDHDDEDHDEDDDDYHDHGNLVDGDVTQVLAVRDKLPDLRAIVQYGEEEVDHEGVIGWEDFQVSCCCLWLRC